MGERRCQSPRCAPRASPTKVRNSAAIAANNGLSAKNSAVSPCTAIASAGIAFPTVGSLMAFRIAGVRRFSHRRLPLIRVPSFYSDVVAIQGLTREEATSVQSTLQRTLQIANRLTKKLRANIGHHLSVVCAKLTPSMDDPRSEAKQNVRNARRNDDLEPDCPALCQQGIRRCVHDSATRRTTFTNPGAITQSRMVGAFSGGLCLGFRPFSLADWRSFRVYIFSPGIFTLCAMQTCHDAA
jgi:hypothetical protein